MGKTGRNPPDSGGSRRRSGLWRLLPHSPGPPGPTAASPRLSPPRWGEPFPPTGPSGWTSPKFGKNCCSCRKSGPFLPGEGRLEGLGHRGRGFLGETLADWNPPLSRRPRFCPATGILHRISSPRWCREAEFVFHLAGVNRAPNPEAFLGGNFDFTKVLLARLAGVPALCCSPPPFRPVPHALRSEQAGRRGGPSALAQKPVRRFFCTVCLTFTASGPPGLQQRRRYLLPPHGPGASGHHPESRAAAASGLRGRCGGGVAPLPGRFPNRQGKFCRVSEVFPITLGEILALLAAFARSRAEGTLPCWIPPLPGSSMPLTWSFLPRRSCSGPMSCTKTCAAASPSCSAPPDRGQLSVSITRPGIVRGNHWHQTKAEKFWVIQGEG